MTNLQKHLPHPFTRDRAVLGGVLLSVAVGLMFYVVSAAIIESDANKRFRNTSQSAKATIEARIKSYTDLLRGSASLFGTSIDLTRSQFHSYVEGLELERQFPGIETINFARFIHGTERAAFEEKMNRDAAEMAPGYPRFEITPPGQRDYYTVLTYIEPISAWARRFGWDISARGNAKALEQARDTGEMSSSGVPIAPLSGTNKVGLAMRMPIYRSDVPHDTVEGRRLAYLGSVGIGFSVNKLVGGIIEQLPTRDVRMVLTDLSNDRGSVSDDGSARTLFDSASRPDGSTAPAAAAGTTFNDTLLIQFGRRVWRANFSAPKRKLLSDFDLFLPLITMALGGVSTFLLFSLFHAITASRRHAVALAATMTQELRYSEGRLQRSNENLRRLAAHSNNIKEEERRRIAREIHDDLGQSLMALRIDADMLCTRTSGRQPRLHARAAATLRQIDATIKSVRQIINDLRPTVLDLGLSAAVEWQIREFRRRTGMHCRLTEPHGEVTVSDQCATALFRILQESLNNIARHARASEVDVVLSINGGWIGMTVRDNGVGIRDRRSKKGSFGLVGIEERMRILNGTFRLECAPGAGTTVHVSVPADADPQVPAEFLELEEEEFQARLETA